MAADAVSGTGAGGGALGPVVITGGAGLLGSEVARVLSAHDLEAVALSHQGLDVGDERCVREAVTALRPRAVVHCAALTNVDTCETDPQSARRVNELGSGYVAAAAAAVGAEVIAVSTDYVFDGEKGKPYVEADEPNPIQEYGRTKLGGEWAVRAENDRHYVVRSAWIYGQGGKNFLSQLFGLVKAGQHIKAVADQFSSPTYAADLAAGIVSLLGSEAYGTHHIVNPGVCSFAEFASQLLAEAGIEADVEPIARAQLGRPAPRPANTALDGPAWRATGLGELRSWRDAAKEFAASCA